MKLSPEQVEIEKGLTKWYTSSTTNAILEGKAGSGKTFLIDSFLKKLGKMAKPLLIAETNEAVRVLREATFNQYSYATVCQALNLVPTVQEHELVLVQRSEPKLKELYNFIIVDEGSMLGEDKLAMLVALGIKTLFIAHRNQLPGIEKKLGRFMDCMPPVFNKPYPLFTLLGNMRNQGEIGDFCELAEQAISDGTVLIPDKFIIYPTVFENQLTCKQHATSFFKEKTVYLCYTNAVALERTAQIRFAIFGNLAYQQRFIITDKIIFRRPTALYAKPINRRSRFETVISNNKANTFTKLTVNTRAVVKHVSEIFFLGMFVYEIYVETNHWDEAFASGFVYIPMIIEEFDKFLLQKRRDALYAAKVEQQRKWELYHASFLLFASVQHAYARTIHTAQGSTIPNVYVDENDIFTCQNLNLRNRLRYVAYSRPTNNLWRLRNVS